MIEGGELTTERLHVRPFDPADAERLVEIFSDPMVARFVGDGSALDRVEASDWIANSRANLARFGYGTGAVVETQSQRLIGWAGFARPEGGLEEIIYGFERGAWGTGLGTELFAALVEFGAVQGVSPLRATVDQRNLASIKILKRKGFELSVRDYRGEAGCLLYERKNAGKIA